MNGTYTLTALRRWSCVDRLLPRVEDIKHIHIYDFDNTLFSSPLPSRQLWNGSTWGQLQGQDFLHNGGWWHNPRILAAVGQGADIEEKRAWQGCWNETIVDLVRLSMEDNQTLTVLLTGRQVSGFSDLITRMITAKRLEFDIVALKPAVSPQGERFGSTLSFKQALLKDIICTYPYAEEIRVYEDRVKHVKAFREFFTDVNNEIISGHITLRAPITAEVIRVAEQDALMDPVTEVSEVQRMINYHNQSILDGTAPVGSVGFKIKRTVFYTGYIIPQPDIDRLKTLVKISTSMPEHEVRHLANNILITPRPAPPSILEKVGGIGAKMSWRVTGVASLENRVWAARVQPTVPGAKFFTENHTPSVVLAVRRQAKPIEASRIQNWQPVPDDQAIEFETTVGEKALLRIEEEVTGEDEYEASFPNARNARKHSRDDDFPPLGARDAKQPRSRNQQRGDASGNSWSNFRGGRGGFSAQRGVPNAPRGPSGRGGAQLRGPSFNGGRARGTGRGRGRGNYRSLDDNVGQGYGGDSMQY